MSLCWLLKVSQQFRNEMSSKWRKKVKALSCSNMMHQRTLNPTLNPNDSVNKQIWDCNQLILACYHKSLSCFIMLLIFHRTCTQYHRIANAVLYQWSYLASLLVYYNRKAIDVELVIWCKHQNESVYKSCTIAKAFSYQNRVLHKEPYKNES